MLDGGCVSCVVYLVLMKRCNVCFIIVEINHIVDQRVSSVFAYFYLQSSYCYSQHSMVHIISK